MATTLSDIARVSGVHRATVSKILLGKGKASTETRARVLRLAEEMHYVPNPVARSLILGKTDCAGIAADSTYYLLFQKQVSLQDAFFSSIIRIIQQELFERGKSCSVGIMGDDYLESLRLYQMLQVGNVGGIFVVGDITPKSLDLLLETCSNKVVLVDNPGWLEVSKPFSAVFCENAHGALQATNHLIRLGRRRILLITNNEEHYFSKGQVDGYRKAHIENGIEIDESLIVPVDLNSDRAYEAAKLTAESGLRFDAVFTNDEMACGVIKGLKSKGVRIPDDISVVGFDDLDIGKAIEPALTTVSVDRTRMCEMAAEILLDTEHDTGCSRRVGLYPKLTIRRSCGAIKDVMNNSDELLVSYQD
ncbi:MAG: LacI family DNA-binding transcriptional regulator [Armatimonadota bacterium]